MTQRKRVWILENEGLPHEVEINMYEQANIEVKETTKATFKEDFINFGKDAHAIVVGVEFPFDQEMIHELKHCEIICSFGMGFDQIDLKAAAEKNIYVTHLPNYCHEEVADHTLALSLSLLRRLFAYHKNVRAGKWEPTNIAPIQRLSDTVVGLLGFGQIARMVAKRFQPFGVKVIAHDKYVTPDVFENYNVSSVSLDTLFSKAHLLSLHVPLTPETKHLINESNLAKMPKGALIVNTCRGEVVDEQALIKAIQSGHILSAGLDVLNEEPPSRHNELLQMDEVIITPHAAYYSVQAETQMQTETATNILRVFNHQPPFNVVNKLE